MYVYFYPAPFQKEQEITEVHCQVGMRAEVECGVLGIYGEGNAIKREQQELCSERVPPLSV